MASSTIPPQRYPPQIPPYPIQATNYPHQPVGYPPQHMANMQTVVDGVQGMGINPSGGGFSYGLASSSMPHSQPGAYRVGEPG